MSDEQKNEGYIAENADAEADTIFGAAPAPAPVKGGAAKSGGLSKNAKGLIAAVCALAVLGGALAAVLLLNRGEEQGNDPAAETEPAEETIMLNAEPAADVTGVDVSNGEEFSLFRITPATEDTKAVYGMRGYEDIPMDSALLSTLVNNASELEAVSLVEEHPDDLAKYGLADPKAEVTMHYADGTDFTLLIGDASPMESGRTYCGADGNVYLVRSSKTANYLKNKDAFLSMTILEEPADADYPIVDSVRVRRQDLDYDIYIEYDYEGAEDDSAGGTAATHVMLEPRFAYLSVDKSVGITNGMFGLTAEEAAIVHPEEADFAKAGLDDPFCTVDMSCDNGESYHLMLGDAYTSEDGKTLYYAYLDGENVIYGVTADAAAWLTVQPGDITSASIFVTNVWNIGTLDIKAGDRHLLFEGEGTEQADYEVTKNGETCDTERFRQLYRFLLYIYGEELYMGELPEGEPDAEVHLMTQNGREDYTVRFYQQSDLRTIVVRNDTAYTVRTSCLHTLLHNLDIFDDESEEFINTWQ